MILGADMTPERMREIARGNIERNLSDAVAEDGEDAMYDTVYTLAFDALHDAGVSSHEAGEIASQLAMEYACP